MMVAQFKAGALLMKVAWAGPEGAAAGESVAGGAGTEYYVGLALFSLTVVGYTLLGGFLAAVWTDMLQSVLMLVGVLTLLALALPAAGGLEQATRDAVAVTGPEFATAPGYAADGRQFLPLTLAFSFFVIWPFTSFTTPAAIVRVMAARCIHPSQVGRSAERLQHTDYPPLIAICICAGVMPDRELPTAIPGWPW
jgi:SSS family solute:Na+ symporter/sodium/pantothenate symporter